MKPTVFSTVLSGDSSENDMFHPHVQRVIVLAAGIFFIAYAIATDAERAKPKTDDDDRGDDGTADGDDHLAEISNVVDTASEAGRFGTWSLAVKQAGLTGRLEDKGPFTLFAPTDDAFAKLGEALDELLADKTALRQTIERHVVEGRLTSVDLGSDQKLVTLAGTELTVTHGDPIRVGDSAVVDADLTASNGVIHGIDTVLPG